MKNKLTALEKDNIKKQKEAIKMEKLMIKENKRIEKFDKMVNKLSTQQTTILLNKSIRIYIKYEKYEEKETLKKYKKFNKDIIKINNNYNKIFKIKDDRQPKKSSKKVKKIIKIKNDEIIINDIIEFKDENNIINNMDIEDKNDEELENEMIIKSPTINNINNIEDVFKSNNDLINIDNNINNDLMEIEDIDIINKKINNIVIENIEVINNNVEKMEIEEIINNKNNNIIIVNNDIINDDINDDNNDDMMEEEKQIINDDINDDIMEEETQIINYNSLNRFKDYEFKKLNDAITYRKQNNLSNYILLAKDIIENESYKSYIVANDRNKKRYIDDDFNLYELLIKYDDNQNYKLYLDIDKDILKINLNENNEKNNYIKQFFNNNVINDKFYDVLIKFINNLLSYIKQNYGYEYSNEENQFYILKSTLKTKISYHIIFNYVIFKHINQMKLFIKKMMVDLKDNELIKNEFIDDVPYNNNQLFRLYGNSKKGKNNKLLFDERFIKNLFENDFYSDIDSDKSEDNNDYKNKEYKYINSYKLNHKIDTYIITSKTPTININILDDVKIQIKDKKMNDNKMNDNINKCNNNLQNINVIFDITQKDNDQLNKFMKNDFNNMVEKLKPLNNSKYLKWYYIIKNIKILSNDYNLFVDYNGDNYDINENKKIYDNININNKDKFDAVYSLFIELKNIDFDLYKSIINKYNSFKQIFKIKDAKHNIKYAKDFYNIDNSLINKTIELKTSDLTDNKYLNKDIITNAYNNNYQNIIIKSGLGTGKSVSVCNFLNYYINNIDKDVSILIVSPRISYSNSIIETLEKNLKIPFKKYNDKNINFKEAKRLIISIYSIEKIKELNYDIIVLDEIESILNSFKDYKIHINYLINFQTLERLINNSKVNLLLDGDINNTSLELFNKINKKSILYINNNNFNKRNVIIYNQLSFLTKEIMKNIEENKKVVIFHYSKEYLKELEQTIKYSFENKLIITHYSNAEDNKLLTKKQNNKFVSINDIWNKSDVLIYNSSITVGIDFNIEYFDKIFIIYDTINIVRDVIQSINRIRKYKENEIHLYGKFGFDIGGEVNINIDNDDKINKFIDNVISDKEFNIEYDQYIEKTNDYNLKIKNNIDIDGLDFGIISLNKGYNNKEVITHFLTKEEYFNSKYDKMNGNIRTVYNKTITEFILNKKYSLSFFFYFFSKCEYNISFNRNSEYEPKEGIQSDIYFESKKLFLNLLIEIDINKEDYKQLNIFEKKEIKNKLFTFIINQQNNKNYKYVNNENIELIKKYINFSNKYEFKINSCLNDKEINEIKNKVFKLYNSNFSNKYFLRYNEFINNTSVYDMINNKLNKSNIIETINKDIYEINEIRKNIINILKINNINECNIISNSEVKLSLDYINEKIEIIKKMNDYKDLFNDKKKDNKLNYKLLKNILLYYNVDLSYEDIKRGPEMINPTFIINKNNNLQYITIKKYNNDNNNENLFLD
jgi:hypothetical protein